MRVTSLASGSSGNALLIEAGSHRRTKILIDAGIPARLLLERLRRVGVSADQLQAVFLTHEHSDHILGLPTLIKRYALPIISDARTLQATCDALLSGVWRTDSGTLVNRSGELSGELEGGAPLDRERLSASMNRDLSIGSPIIIGDMEILSFSVSHDAIAPCGYLMRAGGCRVCVAIDSGEVTPAMLEVMQLADLLILESNHDREKLLRGPYPEALKRRILSSTGHLSNDQAADAVLRTWRPDGVRWLWLAHLSRTNNTPQLALSSMRSRLEAAQANLDQVHISVLPPGMGSAWDSTQLWRSSALWEMEW